MAAPTGADSKRPAVRSSAHDEVPLLVTVVGGNAVTAAAVLGCLNTADANALRRLHPVFAAHVAAIAWTDTTTGVYNTVRWRAVFPAAVGCKPCSVIASTWATTTWQLVERPVELRGAALTALRGVTVLDLERSIINDSVVAGLPHTLRRLSVSGCRRVTRYASFTHLHALEWLDCRNTQDGLLACLPHSLRELVCTPYKAADFGHLRALRVLECHGLCDTKSTTTLPSSLEELVVRYTHCRWPHDWSAAHLTHLRVLRVINCNIHETALTTLPPSLHILDLQGCEYYFWGASFAQLTCLHTLNLEGTGVYSAALATLPPSLVSLNLMGARKVDKDAVFPHLPALRVLNVFGTRIGDAALASMPRGLEELHTNQGVYVTQRAILDYLATLRAL